MPYELSFVKSIAQVERESYCNNCCVGGDLIAEALLPALTPRYGELDPIEEDWGWHIGFKYADVKLAVDIFCDDPDKGEFRVHLTSRVRGFFGSKVRDTPELEILKRMLIDAISAWEDYVPAVTKLDEKYFPITANVA
ncbi:hypothetical protein GTP23_06690 [Pseudoduganella sp. FT93W]|uniref:Uncharacterized protein n=1 Tax=Duganella fentianensis TaxID=2692177 RepID=A0A845HUQ9_9BURK|nr:hypothetical protein [Duganella fentianensis]MYN44759.1 hypothetical protein [Duganella fentianensis]